MPAKGFGKDWLDRVFTYHPPTVGQVEQYTLVRNAAAEAAYQFTISCPNSIELTIAMEKMQESVMWANAAIARQDAADHIKRFA